VLPFLCLYIEQGGFLPFLALDILQK